MPENAGSVKAVSRVEAQPTRMLKERIARNQVMLVTEHLFMIVDLPNGSAG